MNNQRVNCLYKENSDVDIHFIIKGGDWFPKFNVGGGGGYSEH